MFVYKNLPWPSIRFLVSIVCSLRAVVGVDIIFKEVEVAVNASVVVEAPSRRSVIDLSMVKKLNLLRMRDGQDDVVVDGS